MVDLLRKCFLGLSSSLDNIFTAEKTWEILAAVSAVFTVVAVFILPVAANYLKARYAQKMVSAELRRARDVCADISKEWDAFKSRDKTAGSGFEHALTVDTLCKAISTELWESFRFQTGPTAYWCYQPFYVSLDYIKHPDRGISTDNPAFYEELIEKAKLRVGFAEDYLAGFSTTSAKCKYLRR